MNDEFYLIDPPVGPYSTEVDIRAWIAELEAMPASTERDEALQQAREWLAQRDDSTGDND